MSRFVEVNLFMCVLLASLSVDHWRVVLRVYLSSAIINSILQFKTFCSHFNHTVIPLLSEILLLWRYILEPSLSR